MLGETVIKSLVAPNRNFIGFVFFLVFFFLGMCLRVYKLKKSSMPAWPVQPRSSEHRECVNQAPPKQSKEKHANAAPDTLHNHVPWRTTRKRGAGWQKNGGEQNPEREIGGECWKSRMRLVRKGWQGKRCYLQISDMHTLHFVLRSLSFYVIIFI